jgi:hypothetical protein
MGEAVALAPPPPPAPRETPVAEAAGKERLRLEKHLDSILAGLKSPGDAEAVRQVFQSLSHLRGLLRLVELNAGGDGPASVNACAFALVECETRSLIRFIETRVPALKGVKGPLRETLDGMSFALRHELKRACGVEASATGADGVPRPRTEVLRAQGLLSNCFEQSILSLVRVFDPAASGELLFDDYRCRLKQSAVLLRELAALLELARRAGEGRDAAAGALLLHDLDAFCRGPMHHLMYRDWTEFEDIAREVVSSEGSARHAFILHCFATYLSTLLSQVRMRVVLNDHRAARAETKAPKAAAKAAKAATKKTSAGSKGRRK